MENFNIKRFANTFKWLFCEQRSHLLAWTAGWAVGIFVVQTLILWVSVGHVSGMKLNAEMVAPICAPITYFCAFIALLLAYSQIFSTVKTKQKRIAFLTLPATNLERYLAALVMAVVVWAFFILLAVILGDTLRMVFFGILGKGWVSGVAAFSHSGSTLTGWARFMDNALDVSTWLWTCSLYVLGGTWFRKREFLFTSIIQIVIVTAAIWVITQLGIHYNASQPADNLTVHLNTLIYPATFGLFALALLNFWGSYQIFKRFQLITSKWTNL